MSNMIYIPAIQTYIKSLERKKEKENNPLIKEIIEKDIDEAKKHLTQLQKKGG